MLLVSSSFGQILITLDSISKHTDKITQIRSIHNLPSTSLSLSATSKQITSSAMLSTIIVLLLAFSYSHSLPINCRFFQNREEYACDLSNLRVAESEFDNITIGGDHLQDRENQDVVTVNVVDSDVPFVIRQFFEAFPNLSRMTIVNAGLRHLRRNDFANARNLATLFIHQNPLKFIPAGVFAGASNLNRLDLFNNAISALHDNAFVGLSQVTRLSLESNEIESIPPNLFRPLIRLNMVFVGRNKLEKLHGETFAHNNRLHQISFNNNQINAIARNFLDPISEIFAAELQGNLCVNRRFLFTRVEVIRGALEDCFVNYEL
jgi:Leucine-rich repeat (LRR) protein